MFAAHISMAQLCGAQPFPGLGATPAPDNHPTTKPGGLVTGKSFEAGTTQGTWTLLIFLPHLWRNGFCLTRCNRPTSALCTWMESHKKKSPRRQIKVGAQNRVWDEKLFFPRTNKTSSLSSKASVGKRAGCAGQVVLTP